MTPKIMFIKPTTKTAHTHTYTSTYVDIQKGNVEKKIIHLDKQVVQIRKNEKRQ